MEFDDTLDAVGLLCPLPVLKARKRLTMMQGGQVLRVLADDPAAVIDFPHFCNEQGHELLNVQTESDVNVYFIQKSE
jgi:tRNA 2-thiouridine synthesizing protein A